MAPRLLLISDDRAIRLSLDHYLSRKGFAVSSLSTGRQGIARFQAITPALVLLDLTLPDLPALEVLAALRQAEPAVPVVVLAPFDEVPPTIAALQLGAIDYINKPLEMTELEPALARALTLRPVLMMTERRFRSVPVSEPSDQWLALIGRSRTVKDLRQEIAQCADRQQPLFLWSEPGMLRTGLARLLHLSGPHPDRSFHELAAGDLLLDLGKDDLDPLPLPRDAGMVLLRRLDCVPTAARPRLISLLSEIVESRNTRVVVTVSFRDADDAVAQRQALTANGKVIHFAPLRERKVDLPLLVQYYLKLKARALGQRAIRIETAALQLLSAYDWPGNIRELVNLIDRAVAQNPGSLLSTTAIQALLGTSPAE